MGKLFSLLIAFTLFQYCLLAQDSFLDSLKSPSNTEYGFEQSVRLYPNGISKSIITPTAWGGQSTYLFAVFAGTYPQSYLNVTDLVSAVGIGLGNSYKIVHLIAMLNINDVSSIDNFSFTFITTRNIGKGSSISLGGFHLFRDKIKSDSRSSFYFALSHAVQTLPSKLTGFSKLSYTIGFGNGRFYEKSIHDIRNGKTSKGTAIFGNISYEILKNGNIIIEWTGINLGVAMAWRPFTKMPIICLGVADLTRNSGDKPRLVFSFGQSFNLKK